MRSRVGAACLVATAALAACGTVQSPAAAVRAWSSASSFPAAVALLRSEARAVDGVIASHAGARSIRTACIELSTNAQGANNELPTTDHQLTDLLSRAYTQFYNAATGCYDGASTPAGLATARARLHAASGVLVEAVLREEAVAGRSLHVKGVP